LLWQELNAQDSVLVIPFLSGTVLIQLDSDSSYIYSYSGAGPIGLVSLLSARAAGAEPIVITDLFQSRLDFAKKLVPGVRTVLIKKGTTPKEQAEDIKRAADGPLKLTLECTGVESSIHAATYVCIHTIVRLLYCSRVRFWPSVGIVDGFWWEGIYYWGWEERTVGAF
jgi:hypothetical protein